MRPAIHLWWMEATNNNLQTPAEKQLFCTAPESSGLKVVLRSIEFETSSEVTYGV